MATATVVDERPSVSIQQACAVVGVSRRTIYNWLETGKLAYRRTAGGSVRIFVDSLWREPDKAIQSDRACAAD